MHSVANPCRATNLLPRTRVAYWQYMQHHDTLLQMKANQADYDAWATRENELAGAFQEAYWQDTQHVNSRDHCRCVHPLQRQQWPDSWKKRPTEDEMTRGNQ